MQKLLTVLNEDLDEEDLRNILTECLKDAPGAGDDEKAATRRGLLALCLPNKKSVVATPTEVSGRPLPPEGWLHAVTEAGGLGGYKREGNVRANVQGGAGQLVLFIPLVLVACSSVLIPFSPANHDRPLPHDASHRWLWRQSTLWTALVCRWRQRRRWSRRRGPRAPPPSALPCRTLPWRR